jgi:peptide/nickel transport system ATP-binding protein
MSDPLVSVRDLEKYYHERDTVIDRLLGVEPTSVKAVDGVSFDIQPGETLGLVGESGCGKSTAGETLLGLREPTDGAVYFDGENVFEMDEAGLAAFRRRAQVVFQDPFSSLDPRMTAGEIVREPMTVHGVGTKEERRERAGELLDRVGLSADQRDRYPHEFSGGQRQRIGVARALALEPDFIVLDEPVSALDVSVQAQILNLLADLQKEFGLTYLFIAHDLSVVRHISDRVAVMYLGNVVEIGDSDAIFEDPRHPYTEKLLESVPRADVAEQGRHVDALEGDVPSPRNPPSGCRFRTRCPAVIPPDDIEIDQDAYREVMDYRDRLAGDELSLAAIRAEIAGADGDPDDVPADAFVEALWDELFESELAGRNREVVAESFEWLYEGEIERAEQVLTERFASVCERQRPVLQEWDHPAACHLFEQPVTGEEIEADD